MSAAGTGNSRLFECDQRSQTHQLNDHAGRQERVHGVREELRCAIGRKERGEHDEHRNERLDDLAQEIALDDHAHRD